MTRIPKKSKYTFRETNYWYPDSNNIPDSHIKIARLSLFYSVFKNAFDNFSFWSQLVINLALSVERHILIARGRESKMLLTDKRRRWFYTAVVVTSLVFPLLYIVDFFVTEGYSPLKGQTEM